MQSVTTKAKKFLKCSFYASKDTFLKGWLGSLFLSDKFEIVSGVFEGKHDIVRDFPDVLSATDLET